MLQSSPLLIFCLYRKGAVMSMMVTEVYEAFIAAGVPDDKAKAAAAALSEEQLSTKGDINRLESRLIVVQWMVGLVVAVEVLPYLKAVFG